MQEAKKKAEEAARKEAAKDNDKGAASPDPNQKEVEIDFDVRNTGQKKTINGYDTAGRSGTTRPDVFNACPFGIRHGHH